MNDGVKDETAPIWAKLAAHNVNVLAEMEADGTIAGIDRNIVIGGGAGVAVLLCLVVVFCVKRRLASQHDQVTRLQESMDSGSRDGQNHTVLNDFS